MTVDYYAEFEFFSQISSFCALFLFDITLSGLRRFYGICTVSVRGGGVSLPECGMQERQYTERIRSNGSRWAFLSVVVICAVVSSCRNRGDHPSYLGEVNSANYLDRATHIAHIDLDHQVSSKVNFAVEPRRIRDERKDEIWDLSLSETIQTCLTNSRVIRNSGQFLSPGNPLLSNPEFVRTIYDSAIQESGVLFGRRGVEAALSDFDAQFTTQLLVGSNETIQNNIVSNGLPAGSELDETSDIFRMSLRKRLATGGQISLSHNWTHTGRNIPAGPGETQLFTTVYDGITQLQFRQPLLAGGGVEYTRIAGPISENIQGITGVQQGVIIGRIQNDLELADFEIAVHQLIHDVEELYWQLHFAYLSFDIQSRARDRSGTIWRTIDSQRQAGTGSGGAREADVREIYLDWKGRADLARDQIYSIEAQLRRLMGLSVNDGRIIRPSDDPLTVEYIPNWQRSLTDALVKRPEIRRQKWSIQSLQYQITAAENLLLPRLDLVTAYQVNGFGDELFGRRSDSNPAIPSRIDNAYESLFSGNQTGWNIGLEFSVPLGRRFAKTQLLSLELQLAKARAVLADQEVELSHEVAAAFRDVDRTFATMENSYNILHASQTRRDLRQAQYISDPQRYTIEDVLQAEGSVAQAEVSLASAVAEYNVTLVDLNYRTGQTLKASNVTLLEGNWNADAYVDAKEEFHAREYAEPAPRRESLPQMNPYDGEFE